MTPHRDTDNEANLHINRTIPLWGIVTLLGMVALQAISLYYGQASQGEKIAGVQVSVTAINVKLDSVQVAQNKSDLKDLEHDFKITSLTNRIAALENVLQRQLPPLQQQQR